MVVNGIKWSNRNQWPISQFIHDSPHITCFVFLHHMNIYKRSYNCWLFKLDCARQQQKLNCLAWYIYIYIYGKVMLCEVAEWKKNGTTQFVKKRKGEKEAFKSIKCSNSNIDSSPKMSHGSPYLPQMVLSSSSSI